MKKKLFGEIIPSACEGITRYVAVRIEAAAPGRRRHGFCGKAEADGRKPPY